MAYYSYCFLELRTEIMQQQIIFLMLTAFFQEGEMLMNVA